MSGPLIAGEVISDQTRSGRPASRDALDYPVIAVLTSVHVAALSALVVPPTGAALALFFVFYLLSGFGITIGFHRLLSHRAFVCGPRLLRVFATLGTVALQGGPVFWAGLHRRHHQRTDRDGDPHSPQESFLDGHMLWMTRRSTKNAAVLAALSHRDLRLLTEDAYIKWLDRGLGPLVPWFVTLGICGLVAGLEGVVWGGFVRTVVGWHSTWLVNSVGHRFGARPHETSDQSRNVWWLSPLAFGDQWHNNHHAQPRRAILTERCWQVDPSGWVIILLEKLGLATSVVRDESKEAVQ